MSQQKSLLEFAGSDDLLQAITDEIQSSMPHTVRWERSEQSFTRGSITLILRSVERTHKVSKDLQKEKREYTIELIYVPTEISKLHDEGHALAELCMEHLRVLKLRNGSMTRTKFDIDFGPETMNIVLSIPVHVVYPSEAIDDMKKLHYAQEGKV